jgi:hypothetical protein
MDVTRQERGTRGRKVFVETSPRRTRQGVRGMEVMRREGSNCKNETKNGGTTQLFLGHVNIGKRKRKQGLRGCRHHSYRVGAGVSDNV